jgi:hypothetical protein
VVVHYVGLLIVPHPGSRATLATAVALAPADPFVDAAQRELKKRVP